MMWKRKTVPWIAGASAAVFLVSIIWLSAVNSYRIESEITITGSYDRPAALH